MRTRVFSLLAAWLGLAMQAHALIERKVERRFEVPATASLRLDTFSGAVNVTAADVHAIEILVRQQFDVEKDEEADRRLRDLDLAIEQKADGAVVISGKYRQKLSWTWQNWPPVLLVYEIKVPRQCDLDLRSRDGGITVEALKGNVVLHNETGSLFTGEIDGTIKAGSRSGDIAITACTGAVDVRTSTGNIVVGRAGGRTDLASDGGYIEVQRARGRIAIKGNGSDAKVGFVRPVEHEADVSTSGGNLLVVFDKNTACLLDVRSSVFGHIKAVDLALTVNSGALGRSQLQGTLNGGGPRLTLRASGGHVVLRGLDPMPDVDVSDPTSLPMM